MCKQFQESNELKFCELLCCFLFLISTGIVSGNLRSANLVESLEEGMVEVLPIPTPHGSLLKEGQLGINEMLTGEGKHLDFHVKCKRKRD